MSLQELRLVLPSLPLKHLLTVPRPSANRCSLPVLCSQPCPCWACLSSLAYVLFHPSASGFLVISSLPNPQVSALRTSTSDKTPFVRTHLAMCFFSLLLCNLFQAIGGIMSITWVIEHRVFAGVICTAQAAIKQLGNVRPLLSFTLLSGQS